MANITAYPSGSNTFVPSLEGSKRLLVDFSRNPKDFSLNRYITLVPCDETIGYYTRMTVEERMRILSTTLAEFVWPDGADAPAGNEGKESFSFRQFQTIRYAYRVNLGKLASDQAAWDIIGQHVEIKAQQAMTARTVSVLNTLQTAGNWTNTAHTAAASVTGGGFWPAATTANLYIKKSIDYAVTQILKDTGSVVQADDLILVLSPDLARKMAESQELVDYLKGSPTALAFVRGETSDGPKKNQLYGLPATYAGVKLEIEDAVKVTTRKGTNAQTTSFACDIDKPFIVARPGGLVGKYGGPSFSTATLFVYKSDDMTVETKYDTDNRRTNCRVVDNFTSAITADISGFLFTSVTQ